MLKENAIELGLELTNFLCVVKNSSTFFFLFQNRNMKERETSSENDMARVRPYCQMVIFTKGVTSTANDMEW